MSAPPNKRLQLTRRRAAPVPHAEVPPCAPAGEMDGAPLRSRPAVFGRRRVMDDTCRLYTDLAWLWPMWGDAADEYAHYCRHVAGLIERHAGRPAGTLLDIGCGGGKNVFNLKGGSVSPGWI